MLNFLKKHYLFCVGSILLILLLFITFIGPYTPIVDRELETITYVLDENRKPVIPPYPPSDEFLLGTDKTGRDLLSLLILGAKETLLMVVLITVIRYLFAIPLSYFAHKKILGTHHFLNWMNGLFSYIPTIIIVILIATLPPILFNDFRPHYLVMIIALVEVARAADMIKLEFDEISSKEYIKGGISSGSSSFTLFRTYYLPFLYGKILVYMISDLGRVMFLLGQLGFIGIYILQELIQLESGMYKVINESISWPMMLMEAFEDVRGPIWIPFYSALAMTYAIFTFNLFAQGLQNFFKKKVQYI